MSNGVTSQQMISAWQIGWDRVIVVIKVRISAAAIEF
jgi:hypothetical protein